MYQLLDCNFWDSQVLDQPLHRRGWVVQERLLAPRVLHFSSQQLAWECRSLDAAEKYPRGLTPYFSKSAAAMFKNLDPNQDGARLRKLGNKDPDPKFFFYELWNKIVGAYSKSLLTFGEDKLIALSGIAKRQQREMNDRYIAGLWDRFLPSQLLWHVEDCRQIDNNPSARPAKYRAPSFSWASIDGIIRPGNISDDGYLVNIIEVSVTPAGTDLTGIVDSGFLRLRGVLKELQLRRHDQVSTLWLTAINGVEIRTQAVEEWDRVSPLIHLDVEMPPPDGTKYCMPFRAPSKYNTFVSGLILETTGDAIGQFRRIGTFTATKEEMFPLILARHENEIELPCEAFDPEIGKHTICIV